MQEKQNLSYFFPNEMHGSWQPTAQTPGLHSVSGQNQTTPENDFSKIPKWRDIIAKPEYKKLSFDEKTQFKQDYFNHFIAPHAGSKSKELYQEFMSQKMDVPERTWGEAFSDTGKQLIEGAYNIGGALPNLVAPDSGMAEFFRGGADKWNKKQSDSLKTRIYNADIDISQAGEDGVAAQIAEAAGQYFSDPGLAARFVFTNLASMVPGIGAAKIAQTASLARSAARGLSQVDAARKASRAAILAATGTNMALNGGGARGDAFEDIKQTLMARGLSEEDATDQALSDSRVVGLVGAIAAIPGPVLGLEGAVFGKAVGGSVLKKGAKAVVGELGTEQLEEVSPKIATNMIARKYDGRSVGQDVGRTMVETAIGTMPGAGLAGGAAARHTAKENRLLNNSPALLPPAPTDNTHPMVSEAESVVRELAEQEGIPAETVLPSLTEAERQANHELMSTASFLIQELRAKRDGHGAMSDAFEDEGPGDGLTPDEQSYLTALEQAMSQNDYTTLQALLGASEENQVDTLSQPEVGAGQESLAEAVSRPEQTEAGTTVDPVAETQIPAEKAAPQQVLDPVPSQEELTPAQWAQQLRDRMKYIREQARNNQGWNSAMAKEFEGCEKELALLEAEYPEVALPQEKTAKPAQPVQKQDKTPAEQLQEAKEWLAHLQREADKTGLSEPVRKAIGDAKSKIAALEKAYPELAQGVDVSPAAEAPKLPKPKTEKEANQRRDYSNKQFDTRSNAEKFIDDRRIYETHTVVQRDDGKFGVVKKEQQAQQEATAPTGKPKNEKEARAKRAAEEKQMISDAFVVPQRQASTVSEAQQIAKESIVGIELENKNTGVKATLSGNNLGKMASDSATKKSSSATAHALAIANLDTLFKQAVMGWGKRRKTDSVDVKSTDRMFAALVTPEGARLVKLTVKILPTNGNGIYSVEAIEVGEVSPVPEMVEADRNDSSEPLTGLTGLAESMAQAVREFNASRNEEIPLGRRGRSEAEASSPIPPSDGIADSMAQAKPEAKREDDATQPKPKTEKEAKARRAAKKAQEEANSKFANNKIFTADKVEAARARLKSKLNTLNAGIDPELLVDGMTIAGAYIESGVRRYSAYSKAMIADFGESIRPYLRSFYEAARNYPGLDTEGMSTSREIDLMEREGTAEHLKPVPESQAATTPSNQRKTTILTPDGKKVAAEWDVVEADSVQASLKEGISQPRDRTRAASNAQVMEIAANPDFERLSDTSKTMDYGAPTLSKDGLIVGGNGRFEGIAQAYDGKKAKAYRAALEENAARFGLDPETVKGMKQPILVRRVTSDADTRQLAIQSNQAAGLQMSDMEQAALDAERMKGLDQVEVTDTGDIAMTSRNMDNIRRALADYSTNEMAGMMAADGSLSQTGVRRLRNAILFSAYGKSDVLARLIESPDADMRNVATALVRAAGVLSKVRGEITQGKISTDYDVANDLNVAIAELSRIRAENRRLDEFLAQGNMFGDGLNETQRALIQFLADNMRSAKNITELLNSYAQKVLSINGAKDGFFGETELPSKFEVINNETKRLSNSNAKGQQSILDQSAQSGGDRAGLGQASQANEGKSEDRASSTGRNRGVQEEPSGSKITEKKAKETDYARPVQTEIVPTEGTQGNQPDAQQSNGDRQSLDAGVAANSQRTDSERRTSGGAEVANRDGDRGRRDEGSRTSVELGEGRSDGVDTATAGAVGADRGTRGRNVRHVEGRERKSDKTFQNVGVGRSQEPSNRDTRGRGRVSDDDHVIDADEIGKGGLGQKYRDNVAAIKLLKTLETEGRKATASERKTLAKYVGWGAMKGPFDPNNKQWAKQHAELKALLTDKEFEAARASTLDAHYTSPVAVGAMYDALARLGVRRGRILEPSVGIGNFFGLMPRDLRNASNLYGVELDSLTSRLVTALYPKAKIAQATGFQEYDIPSGFFDVVIGNPPFGSYPVMDAERSQYSGFSIHNYFLAKSIDKLRPGGIMVVVVSHNFLDAKDGRARKWIGERANLIGGVRLPNTAFKENAGTEVITDILVFQKHGEQESQHKAGAWQEVVTQVNLNPKTGDSVAHNVNQFFASNPQFVLGKPTAGGSMYSANEYTVEQTGDIKPMLSEWVKALPEDVFENVDRSADTAIVDMAIPDGIKVGSFYVDANGKVMQRGHDMAGNKTANAWQPRAETHTARMKGMIAIRDSLRKQMRLERSADATEQEIEANRKELNRLYDEFLKKFKHLNSVTNRNLFFDDTEAHLIQGLEFDYDRGVSKATAEKEGSEPKAASAKKADIFNRRVAFPMNDHINVKSAKDALVASLNYRGGIDADYMTSIYGKSMDAIVQELGDVVFEDPQTGLMTADEYLSGDVKTKLDEAKTAAANDAKFRRNVEALEKVIPKDKLPSEISVNIGADFIPAEIYGQFIQHISGGKGVAHYIAATAQWSIAYDKAGVDQALNRGRFGTDELSAQSLFELCMMGRGAVVRKTINGTNGKPTVVVAEKETEAARAKQDVIKAEWQKWLWQDVDRAERVASIYNEKLNRIVVRKYDGSHMSFPGMNPNESLLKHQKNGVWRGLQSGQMLLDHVVGAGKTWEMTALAMEMRRLGMARKPLFVVPNHLTQQWFNDFTRLYPGSNVLAARPEDFSKENRERLFAKIITGDWDAVVIGHSSLKKIGLPAHTETAVLEEQVDELTAAIREMKQARGDSRIVADMERIKKTLEGKMKEKLAALGKRSKMVTFDELGVDALFVDEMHEFKNLYYNTMMDRTSGMGNPKGSAKSFDLFVKVRWLFDTFGDKTRFITATGTPVSNSLVEMFNMQRFMQYPTLKANRLHLFDSWAKDFGSVENVYEVAPSGAGYRQSTRFSKFNNLSALMSLYNTFADTVTLDDLKAQEEAQGKRFPVPKIQGGRPTIVVAERSPRVAALMGEPTAETDANGQVIFEADLSENIEISQNEKTGKWGWKAGNSSGLGYETEEEARLGLVSRAMTPAITIDKDSIVGRFANLRQLTREHKGKVNALSLTSEANKAGLDYRLIDSSAPDFPGSKINKAVDNMIRLYQQWKADKGAQLIFCDMSIPLSAKANFTSKPRRLYVRDGAGAVTMEKGTLHSVVGFEELPFFIVRNGTGEKQRFDVHDAATGLLILSDLRSKKDAIDATTEHLNDDKKRQKWIIDREATGEIDQNEIDDYNNGHDVNTENAEDFFMRDDIAGASGNSQFSVYDDIKAKLMAQGVPENEIAFIHDYNTTQAKDKLFKAVNNGEIRFLLGSTPKMGAGTNVQQRLVGLHHIDAPWRPSDLEQREGRIIRRGNELYNRDPDGFEIFIGRYATEQTYDTRRWQILEHKARGIEQLRKYDGTFNEIEDIEGEAANAADMKAAASGDPLILEETRLRNDVKRLEQLQTGHADAVLSLTHKARDTQTYADKHGPSLVSDLSDMLAEVKQYPLDKEGYSPVSIRGGHPIVDRKSAYKSLDAVFTEVRRHIIAGAKITFRGLDFKLEYMAGEVIMYSPTGKFGTPWRLGDNFSPSGFVTRMKNYIDMLPGVLEATQERIEKSKREAADMRDQAKQPFPQAKELEDTRARHKEVQRKLMRQGPKVPEHQKAALAKGLEAQKAKLEKLGYGEALKEFLGNSDNAAFLITNANPLPESQRATTKQARKAVEESLAKLPKKPEVIVVESITDVPGQENMKPGSARGIAVGGKIYLCRDANKGVTELVRTLWHELFHNGLRRFLNMERFIVETRKLYEGDPWIKEMADEWLASGEADVKEALKHGKAYARARGVEEALARLAEYHGEDFMNDSHWKRTIRAAGAWLANMVERLGSKTVADWLRQFTDDEKAAFVRGVFQRMREVEFVKPVRQASTFAEARAAILSFARKINPNNEPDLTPIKNYSENVTATISRNNIDKMLQGKAVGKSVSPSVHSLAVANLDVLFNKAILGWKKEDDEKNPNIKLVHRFFAPFETGTGAYLVKITVKEYGLNDQGKKIYSIETVELNEISPAARWVNATAENDRISPTSTRSARDVLRIAQAVEERNTPSSSAPIPDSPAFMMRNVRDSLVQHLGQAKKRESLSKFKWLHKTVATQYHKAKIDQDYANVFNTVNEMQNHISLAALRPSEKAPGVLPRVDDVKTAFRRLFKTEKSHNDMKAAGNAIFAGTTAGNGVLSGRVWTDDELRQKFNASDAGIALYRQARAAIDASLDETAAAEAWAMAQDSLPADIRGKIVDDPLCAEREIVSELDKQLKQLATAIKKTERDGNESRQTVLESARKRIQKTKTLVEKIFAHAQSLKQAGYAPLMRFGDYAVTVTRINPVTGEVVKDANGETQTEYFGMFETQSEAFAMRDKMLTRYKGRNDIRVSAGKNSKERHKLFQGISPETVALFGDVIGAKEAMRDFYQLALSERSALKRRIERKGTAGFTEDLTRVLANFITSNSRFASQRLFMRTLNTNIENIPKHKGDVLDEAVKLKECVTNSDSDWASPFSSIMFAWFLGGSVASAVVNSTQPVMMTFPYLSQWGVGAAAKALTKAIPYAMGNRLIANNELRAALKKACQEGIVDAQEVFHLYTQGAQSVAAGLERALEKIPGIGKHVKAGSEEARARINAFMTLWGSMFSLAESFNRRTTFLAAWEMAKNDPMCGDPYAFATRSVIETQGIYAKHNRPNWGRRGGGRLVFTFKQYSIMYVELLTRMFKYGGPEGKRAAAIMLAVLFLAAGASGLPFAQDLEDVFDTAGQMMGYSTNMRRTRQDVAYSILGKELGDLFQYGISAQLPLDMSGRLGLGKMIPGTNLLKPSDEMMQRRAIADIIGPMGGLSTQAGDAFGAVVEGNIGQALLNLAPKAVRDVGAGLGIASRGYNTDTKGRKVTDLGLSDALVKAGGFNPTKVANVHRKTMPIQQDISLMKRTQSSIAALWTRGVLDNDQAMIDEAQARLARWNRKNPDLPITITAAMIKSRLRSLGSEKFDRVLKSTPRAIRGRVAEELME